MIRVILPRAVLGLCLSCAISTALADIQYTLTPEPQNQAILVAMQFEVKADKPVVRIPAWCPGFYVLKSYERSLFDIKATHSSMGKPIQMTALTPRSWQVESTAGESVTVTYRVKGDDPGLGFFGVNVRPNTAFVNGPAAFMYVENRLIEPHLLTVKLPEGWDVATAMEKVDARSYKAPGYDEFVDHPIELGKFKRGEFKVMGLPFEVILVSPDDRYPDLQGVMNELKALSEPALRMFGGAPFKKYLYLVHLDVGSFGGGLEHRASTVLAIPNSQPLDIGSLAAHEFFHVWNVKHIRPKALGPFDYTNKVRSRHLWFAEGVTDYYANLHTYEAAIYDEAWLMAILGEEIDTLQSSQSRLTKSLEGACWETWEHGGFGYGDLSYYNKGLVVGLLLDAAIRDATNGSKSLDDVMRLMFAQHKLPQPGYEDDGILKAINSVAGTDLTAFYNACVRSTQELPYSILEKIGLRIIQAGTSEWVSGFDVRKGAVNFVTEDLRKMGIREGDAILAYDGQVSPSVPTRFEQPHPYTVTVLREGVELNLRLTPVPRRAPSLRLVRDPNADERAVKLREGWLRMPKAEGVFNGIIERPCLNFLK